MNMNPYLVFSGDCEAAFRFYEQCLGGKLEVMTHGESPACDSVPADWHGKVMHASLTVGDQMLMGSDSPPQYQEEMKGFSVSLHFKDKAEGERIFNALSEGGEVRMPFQPTFWAAGFGMFTDKFGVPWMVNCDPAS